MNRFRRGARMVLLFRRFTRRMTPAELATNVDLLHQSFIRRQLKIEQQAVAAAAAAAATSGGDGSSGTTVGPNGKMISNTISPTSKREASNQWKKTIGKVVAVKTFQSNRPIYIYSWLLFVCVCFVVFFNSVSKKYHKNYTKTNHYFHSKFFFEGNIAPDAILRAQAEKAQEMLKQAAETPMPMLGSNKGSYL